MWTYQVVLNIYFRNNFVYDFILILSHFAKNHFVLFDLISDRNGILIRVSCILQKLNNALIWSIFFFFQLNYIWKKWNCTYKSIQFHLIWNTKGTQFKKKIFTYKSTTVQFAFHLHHISPMTFRIVLFDILLWYNGDFKFQTV